MTASVFCLSIEPVNGKTFVHGYHLGTIESVARQIAEKTFRTRNKLHPFTDHARNSYTTRTVALIRDGKLFDIYDGTWASEGWEDREDDCPMSSHKMHI
jgi:hypothetical protein